MKLTRAGFGVVLGVWALLPAGDSFHEVNPVAKLAVTGPRPVAGGLRVVQSYGKLPLSFEANRGQTDARVRFLAHGQGYTLFLSAHEAVLSLQKSEAGSPQSEKWTSPASGPQGEQRTTSAVLRMRLVGANAGGRVEGAEELPGKSNYFIGNDPRKWRANIPSYAQVRVEEVYPGVDLVYYGNQGQLEYDFVVRPGASPSVIRLALASGSSPGGGGSRGARGPSQKYPAKIDQSGDLLVRVEGGEVRFHKPVVFQPASAADGRRSADRIPVDGHYTLSGHDQVAFAIGGYDTTKPLVIDPVLSYSTYLGGSGADQGQGIAVDASGNAYVTGSTTSVDFPIASLLQPINRGFNGNAFVAKLSADGSTLVYSTYLGGTGCTSGRGGDAGNAIAVDASGNAYVTGITQSTDFPTANPFQPMNHGNSFFCGANAFVAKLNATGSTLVYSTYLGGFTGPGGWDSGNGIAVDGSGNAYVTGMAGSGDFPTANALQPIQRCKASPAANAFVTKFNASGSALVYSTYLGGSGSAFGCDWANGIAVDSSGNVYLTGLTRSRDFPTTPNAVQPIYRGSIFGGSPEAFVAKIHSSGLALLYSTYLGSSGGDVGMGIAVDGTGSAYLTGSTHSLDFPTTPNAVQRTIRGQGDAFVAKIHSSGSALIYSTYLGGSGVDGANGIAVDGSGNAYVTGATDSTDFPTANVIQGTNHGGSDAFLAKFSPDGSALVHSTYLGGSGADAGLAIAVDDSGGAYLTGSTASVDFPTANPLQPVNRGGTDAFMMKISFIAPTITTVSAPAVTYNANASVTVTVSSAAGVPGGHVTLSMDNGTPVSGILTNGTATFTIPSPNAGDHVLSAVYAGQGTFPASSGLSTLHVNPAATITTVTANPNPSTYGQPVTLMGTVSSGAGRPSGTVTFNDGDVVLGTSPLNSLGQATLITSALPVGLHPITVTYSGSPNFNGSGAGLSQFVYAFPAGAEGGTFVIGDDNAATGARVIFWGNQWAKSNSLSGGKAPSSFKGFANFTSTDPPKAGGTWSTRTGTSQLPPNSVPSYMAVIVSSSAKQSGALISGDIVRMVVVKTDAGYSSDPSHTGSGRVVAVIP